MRLHRRSPIQLGTENAYENVIIFQLIVLTLVNALTINPYRVTLEVVLVIPFPITARRRTLTFDFQIVNLTTVFLVTDYVNLKITFVFYITSFV